MVGDGDFLKQSEALRDLRALEEIERNPSVSQRELAGKLGVAVGIANACVRTLTRKGMVKIRGDNNRTITYHLTKKGVLHKSRLAMEWTRNTIDFYREARQKVAGRLAALPAQGVTRVLLYGATEISEIAVIVAQETGVTVVGIVRPAGASPASEPLVADATRTDVLGVPIGSAEDFRDALFDAVVATVEAPRPLLEAIAAEHPSARVYSVIGSLS